MRPLLLFLLALAAITTQQSEGREYCVYFAQGAEQTDWAAQLAPLRQIDPQATWKFVPLSDRIDHLDAARRAAMALRDGVTRLPCVALADDHGSYTSLPLPLVSTAQVTEAQLQATNPDRETATARREFEAKSFILLATQHFTPPTTPEQCLLQVARTRKLLESEAATEEDAQILTLRVIYPLLMRRYALLYTGAHTPETEAALLDAITALEHARDLNPTSTPGRQAYDERERLRAARLQSRQYD